MLATGMATVTDMGMGTARPSASWTVSMAGKQPW